MEEEKAAAYYDELTRKGSGAAKFKQGLGFSSTSNDVVPSKGSALPSSTSFLSNFVRASKTDDEIDKEGRLQSIQNKLKSKSKLNKTETQRIENENDYQSSRSSRENHTQSNRRNRSRSRSFSRNRSRSFSRDRGRQRNSKNRSRSRSRDKYLRQKRSMERDSRRRSRSRSRDRDSRGRSRSRERSLSRRSRSREWDSRRRSRSRSRERSSRRRSRSRSRERSSTRRSRSRSRERDSKRISRSRKRRSRRISRSRSRSGGDEGRGGRLSKRNETSTSVKNERNGGLDYSKLIDGYDKMAPAERVKAKMKLQLTETAKKDPTRGTGSGWERFDFDKDAALDDEEEIEAAEDDSGIVKRIGQSFRFSAVEARKEDQIKAAHDEAMFGAPSLPLSSEIDEEKEDSPKCINDSAPDTSLISNQVISMQQVSWRDRVKKM